MSNDAKVMRKQLRNITQDVLPELLRSEVFKGLYSQLEAEMKKELNRIHAEITDSILRIDERSRDIQQYLLNEATRNHTPFVKE